jgi:hypothetical protein
MVILSFPKIDSDSRMLRQITYFFEKWAIGVIGYGVARASPWR